MDNPSTAVDNASVLAEILATRAESGYYFEMKITNLSRAKDNGYVAYVRRGGRVRIMVNGVAAADMVPVTGPSIDAESDEDLSDLERHGVVRRGTGGVPPEILKPGPKLCGEPSSATVEAQRADGW